MSHVPNRGSSNRFVLPLTLALGLVLAPALPARGAGVSYENIADADHGLTYARTPSAPYADFRAARQASLDDPITMEELIHLPSRVFGQPGIAVLDYDRDGDLDLYVSNGPGTPNSLFANQLAEEGVVTFVDRAAVAGVEATAQDSTGVCFGDLDNDGDHDLVVLGRRDPNRLYENRGDGTFEEVPASGLGGGSRSSSSCAVGDVDGDGLLDVLVGNTYATDTFEALLAEPFALNEHDQLFRNDGGLRFSDVSAAAGLESLGGLPPLPGGAASITWAVSMVDVDLDGDLDIVLADDQGGIPTAKYDGVDRGLIHVLVNDGTGHFTDRPVTLSAISAGSWMGLGFGDLDCDGHLDIFGSNFGDYDMPSLGLAYERGDQATRLLLGNGDATLSDPGVGSLVASVFGWGNAVLDHDNDGDQDILYHGGLHMGFNILTDNPGVMLVNDACSARFTWASGIFDTDHQRRAVQGAAIGDLDRNGFVDIATVSSVDVPAGPALVPSPASYGAAFDPFGSFYPLFAPTPAGFVTTGLPVLPGSLTVELAQGNGNGSATVSLAGATGLTEGARVNRDGIGAVVAFTPAAGRTVRTPIQGGSSYVSQHALEATFGLGDAPVGRVEVLWPGGARTRLYGVRAGEHVLMPEIPCSYDAAWQSLPAYERCVHAALDDLVAAGVLTEGEADRHYESAKRAFQESRE